MDSRETFERVKLQMSRLNNMWSPTGDTFCHDTEYKLRNAVWQYDSVHPIMQLTHCYSNLRRKYMEWNESATDHSLSDWNSILGSTHSMLEELQMMLNKTNFALAKDIEQK